MTPPAVEGGTRDRHLGVDHLGPRLGQRSVRGGALSIAAQAAKLVLQLGSTVVLARILTPEDFGLVVMVSAFTGVGSVLTGAGLAAPTVQRSEIDHRQVSLLFWVGAGLGAALALAAGALAPLIAQLYSEPRLTRIAQVLASSFLLTSLGVQQLALMQRQMRFGALAVCELTGPVVGIAIAITLGVRGHAYWALVALPPVSAAVTTGLAWVLCGWRPGPPARGTGGRPLLFFGARLSGFHLLNYTGSNLDRVALGWFWGPTPVGLYSRAYRLALMPLRHLNAPLTAVALPTLSRLQADPQRYRATFLRLLEKIGLVVAPGAAVAVTTSDWLVWILLGPGWERAAPVFSILASVAVLGPASNAAGWLFVSQNRSRELLQLGAAELATQLVAVGLGLRWGAVGVAAALALRIWLFFPLVVAFACRRGPVRVGEFLGTLALPIWVFIACLVALSTQRVGLPDTSPVVGLVIAGALAAAVSLAALFITGRGRRAIADFHGLWWLLRDSGAAT